ncbi:uncharacterized protein LOC120273983 isoform X2 [Dioscorea cayenensis subsp. rotundata]|uniref:Uncharacterized protein LOC120273983 isoform X2 n=1 Tax=Dioscorea cayennensis subsp. rotundata TaxID=55577 RepID=A0AB40CD20_DIOCR|nr:uncharacterized protein LOC120273983 isoform X2 [Dioscorea cayenensis subsp. rotundata]
MNFRPSNKKRFKAICKKGCPFYLWAAPMIKDHNTIQIKSGILKHECTRDHNVRHVSAKWVAEHYLDQFRADPGWLVAGIMQAVKKNQQVNITRLKAWRAKSIAKSLLDGDECEQIKSLYDYRLEILRTNPGSTVMFKCNEGIFRGMYLCLGPLKAGFMAGCRPIISVDGCWLKGQFGGQLLSAVGVDANDCIYPIAWAVVDKENYDNWRWFLELLAIDLEINNGHGFAFMSDRQKGETNTKLYAMMANLW